MRHRYVTFKDQGEQLMQPVHIAWSDLGAQWLEFFYVSETSPTALFNHEIPIMAQQSYSAVRN